MANYADAITNGFNTDLSKYDLSANIPALGQVASSLTPTQAQAPTDASSAVAPSVSENAAPRPYMPINAGDGFSGMGASIGGLVGDEMGATIGGVGGSLLDMAVDLYSSSEKRKAERKAKAERDMKETRANLYTQNQNRKANKRADETHESNQALSAFNLDSAKETASNARADRYRALVTQWHANQNKPLKLSRDF